MGLVWWARILLVCLYHRKSFFILQLWQSILLGPPVWGSICGLWKCGVYGVLLNFQSVLKIVGLLKVTLLFYYYSNMRCWCLTERLWFNSDTFLCQVDKLTVVLISLPFLLT